MKRPLWFRRHGFHWTPCTWQGWALVGAFSLFVLLAVLFWAPTAALTVVWVTVCLTVLLIGIAAWTDDTAR